VAKTAVVRQVNRIEQGNFGDYKFCRDGVWELCIDVGAGYRVYYAIAGQQIVLLLCGGDKRTQDKDIERACTYWQDWQRRTDDER
jgi:putative addiction module killer protein